MAAKWQSFPIVGIGASAGGIEALELFFRALPADPGAAFVIVTHLSILRESLLPEVLAQFTDMPVETIRDGDDARPNKVFVLPERAAVGIEKGRLRLHTLMSGTRVRTPIDTFFSELACDQEEYAVGIILSGSDSDGTLGIKAIKEHGGLTMAQTSNGSTPQHKDMPDHAIATGLIDVQVPAEEMPSRLVTFVKGLLAGKLDETEPRFDELRNDIHTLLRNRIGHDFSGYKTKTFDRRVQKRMQIVQSESVGDYVDKLRREPTELAALFRNLLISVTDFFRDETAFAALEKDVIPRLFEERGSDDVIRVWVPGCATGEEVYSVAILLREAMDRLQSEVRVQIFATDIDERSLTTARTARYPTALLQNVSQERRERFFLNEGGTFVVAKEVRDLCIFSPHNIIRDPPFSRLDLVSCRNLLIYFGAGIQNQVIPIFHYSLRPLGYLFLGTAENVSQFSDLFAPINKKNRIFTARPGARDLSRFSSVIGLRGRPYTIDPTQMPELARGTPLRQSVDNLVMDRFAPPMSSSMSRATSSIIPNGRANISNPPPARRHANCWPSRAKACAST